MTWTQGVSAHYQCEHTPCIVIPILSPFLFIQSLYASFLKSIGFLIYLYFIAMISLFILPVPAPGQVLVSVSSITASSISLSWSVASGRVASWEVVWRPADRGTESTSGSLPGNTYTIHHLDSSTIYTVTVRATNVAGTTDSTPILFSTGIIIQS